MIETTEEAPATVGKLYAVIPIYKNRLPDRRQETEAKPRFDLRPMNHAAACNWMEACRDQWTDYRLIEWPADVAWPSSPMLAAKYRRDGQPSADFASVPGAAIQTPTEHEKNEWQRLARAAYASGKLTVGNRFSVAAATPAGEVISLKRFDALQDQYRAWLNFGEWLAE